MNKILNTISESKKRTNIMNGIAIDWQYAKELIPTVLSDTKDYSDEFIMAAKTLRTVLSNIEDGVVELKTFIPQLVNYDKEEME